MNVANAAELEEFLRRYPETQMLEILMPDVNGILRCKRIHRREFATLFEGAFKVPTTVAFLGIRGNLYDDELDPRLVEGDPDQLLLPISGTLAPLPWVKSPTAQVLAGFADMEGRPAWLDPRNTLAHALQVFVANGWQPVVATELEFYLLEAGDESVPKPLLGRIPGTNLRQQGIQYCMADDLWEVDAFLEDVRKTCELQGVPLTAIHSEFSSGQWEINTHHVDDPVLACDHAMLLKRIVKGVARQHGLAATFMAKPFAELAGSGLHIHTSVYNAEGDNIFDNAPKGAPPTASVTLRHAVGGLSSTMAEAMAIFAPNANSYRRFKPGAYAPYAPTWGYNHRDVALRVPVSSGSNRRIEHRVAGADANPYLVMAAVLAGIQHGLESHCEPGPETPMGEALVVPEAKLPARWDSALALFRESKILPRFLGEDYARVFAAVRQGECDDFHSHIPNLDYEWYLRAI